jgi:small subunit ribosomal protein S9
MVEEKMIKPRIVESGKRKEAIARAVLTPEGNGKITINKIDYNHLEFLDKLRIQEPIKIAESVLGKLDFDVAINIRGGGQKGQIDAARLALAKAMVKFTQSKELEKAFLDYDRNLLVADVRRKEAYKPDDSKARAKRQTSYR